jgi:hypothetical protein
VAAILFLSRRRRRRSSSSAVSWNEKRWDFTSDLKRRDFVGDCDEAEHYQGVCTVSVMWCNSVVLVLYRVFQYWHWGGQPPVASSTQGHHCVHCAPVFTTALQKSPVPSPRARICFTEVLLIWGLHPSRAEDFHSTCMTSQSWALTKYMGRMIPLPVHTPCIWRYPSGAVARLPVCTLSCPRPVGPLDRFFRSTVWLVLCDAMLRRNLLLCCQFCVMCSTVLIMEC